MDNIGNIEIIVKGSIGNIELTPDNYDIREIISILENAEQLLYTGGKKDRPLISYQIEKGSVIHILKIPIQFIIGFNAIIGQVNQERNIDFLNLNTSKAFENIQRTAVAKNYTFSIKTSLPNSNEIVLNKDTKFYRTEAIWAEAEFYFYGKIVNAGGKEKANIHLNTDEYGAIVIHTTISFLEQYDINLLYKEFGVRVSGRQHSKTGEIDTSNLNFIEFIDYNKSYNDDYLKGLREKANQTWLKSGFNADEWLKEIRGEGNGYE